MQIIYAGVLVLLISTQAISQDTEVYDYDVHGRVTKAQRVGAISTYSHDRADNRTVVNVSTNAVSNCEIIAYDQSFRINGSSRENGTAQISTQGVCATPVTIAYSTQDGTAITPINYAATSGQVTFQSGETLKTYPLSDLGLLDGSSVDFYVNISLVSGAATITKARATMGLYAD